VAGVPGVNSNLEVRGVHTLPKLATSTRQVVGRELARQSLSMVNPMLSRRERREQARKLAKQSRLQVQAGVAAELKAPPQIEQPLIRLATPREVLAVGAVLAGPGFRRRF
jgi:hypothetical protein